MGVRLISFLRKGLLLPLLVLLFFIPDAKAKAEVLQFGLIETMEIKTIKNMWEPLVDDLSSSTGIPIKMKVFDDYAGVVWAMRAGQVQIAAMGNKSAIEAVDRAGGDVAFRKMDLNGTDRYLSHVITRAGSGLESIDDLIFRAANITFGIGDPNSTSGFVVPGYYLFARKGLAPQRIFKRVIQANHEENLLAVADGRVDAATNNSTQLKRFATSFPEKYKTLKILWTSPPIYSDPIVWQRSLPDKTKAAVRTFLLGVGRPATKKSTARLDHERAILKRITVSGFIASDNRQLLPIREIELYRSRSLIEADGSIPAEQRTAQLQKIDAQLLQLHEQGREAVR